MQILGRGKEEPVSNVLGFQVHQLTIYKKKTEQNKKVLVVKKIINEIYTSIHTCTEFFSCCLSVINSLFG